MTFYIHEVKGQLHWASWYSVKDVLSIIQHHAGQTACEGGDSRFTSVFFVCLNSWRRINVFRFLLAPVCSLLSWTPTKLVVMRAELNCEVMNLKTNKWAERRLNSTFFTFFRHIIQPKSYRSIEKVIIYRGCIQFVVIAANIDTCKVLTTNRKGRPRLWE